MIVALTGLVIVVSAAFGWLSLRTHEAQLRSEMVRGADQLSRSVTSATWHAMRADRRKDAYEVMQTIAEVEGIERIRMFNKEGLVAFSTGNDTGTHVEKASEACAVCHTNGEPLVVLDAESRCRMGTGADGRRTMTMVTAIHNEPSCGAGGCHPAPSTQRVLGVLDITLDFSPVDREIAVVRRREVLVTAIRVLVLAAAIAFLTSRLVTRPLRKLVAATDAASRMVLDRPIDIATTAELADLEFAFNTMQTRLRAALGELQQIREGLEREVDARGTRLRQAEQRLIQSDRMATLGRLCASVAHEINNPLSGVLNLATLMQRLLRDDGVPKERVADFRRYLELVGTETARAGRIVSDLLSFSRRGTPQRAPADLADVVRRTLSLVGHKLALGKVEARTELDPGLPLVHCDRSQIEQVVINLVMNAAEAMPQGGVVTVRTRASPDRTSVLLEVEDTGTGIPQDVLPRIFDPFFSTKEAGKSVGLGLTVVYGIVDAHGGEIDVRSEVGRGTAFTVRLPLDGGGARPAGASQETGT